MRALIGQTLIASIKIKDKQYEIRDTKLTGFLIRINPAGRINYVCEYTRGKRINIGRIGFLTPAQARDRAKEILGDYIKGIDPGKAKKIQKITTFGEFIHAEYAPWFKTNRKSSKSLDNLKHFVSAFGHKSLNEINSFAVEKWRIIRLEKKITAATVNRNLVALKAVFSKACEWGFIENHPLKQLKLARIDNISKVRYLSHEEEVRVRESINQREEKLRLARESANNWRRERGQEEKHSLKDLFFTDYMKPLILISLNTGLRKGELLSLKWENVNLPLATITLEGESTKSGKTRYIPLNKEALNTFRLWHQQCEADKGIVFSNKFGKQLNDIKKAWGNILKKAEIENFRWHDMRHHFASCLVMAGVDLNTVRELLGHSDIKMTLRYAHLAPEHKAQAVAKLDNFRKNHFVSL